MKQWLLVAFFVSVCLFLGHEARAYKAPMPPSNESSYLNSDFHQGWAHLPQAETRIQSTTSSVYSPSLPFKGSIFSAIKGFEKSSYWLEQKEKTILVDHLIQLGFTDIQRIFPFHQFW